MFDDDLVLLDGTISLTDALDTPPISTTRDAATGAAVIDLQKTGANGLFAALILPTNGTPGDTVTAFLEASDNEDMTGDTTGITKLGSFGIAEATSGEILGSETPDVAFVKFATSKRYVRLNLTVGAGDTGVGAAKCYITPYAFPRL